MVKDMARREESMAREGCREMVRQDQLDVSTKAGDQEWFAELPSQLEYVRSRLVGQGFPEQ
jgi:hypothetical protein